jgi:general secretion pathway protein N
LKWWTWLLSALAALLLMLALLVWFLPAAWALPLLASRLHGVQLRDVHGQLWDGEAGQVLDAYGAPLGRLQWQLSRRALVGQVRLQLQFKGPWLDASAAIERAGEQTNVHDAQLRTEPAAWPMPPATPLGVPRGVLSAHIEHAVLRGNWPMELAAQVQWRDAAVHMASGEVALGQLAAQLQGSNGLIGGQLQDDGHGPLRVWGRFQLSPLGWRFDATLQPLGGDANLRRWLAQWGQPDAQGIIHIQRSAGLAAALPTQEAKP